MKGSGLKTVGAALLWAALLHCDMPGGINSPGKGVGRAMGKVVDENGSPQPGVLAILAGEDGERTLAKTAGDGSCPVKVLQCSQFNTIPSL